MCRRSCKAKSSRIGWRTMTAISMRELPPADRPRERLLNQGANALKTAEVLAILLRSGTTGLPVLAMAEFLLTHFGSLAALSRASVGELTKSKGVHHGKAIMLTSASEPAQ